LESFGPVNAFSTVVACAIERQLSVLGTRQTSVFGSNLHALT
jgi:hypothetical protein